jgi:hypothetical protein
MTTQKMTWLRRVALALLLPVALVGAVTACRSSTAQEAEPSVIPEAPLLAAPVLRPTRQLPDPQLACT